MLGLSFNLASFFFKKTAPLPPLKDDGNQRQFAAKSTLNMDDFDKEDREKDGINLAGFLFGNIDERGELEDSDILDDVRMTHVFVRILSLVYHLL